MNFVVWTPEKTTDTSQRTTSSNVHGDFLKGDNIIL